jgi:hypothetical protein
MRHDASLAAAGAGTRSGARRLGGRACRLYIFPFLLHPRNGFFGATRL